METKNRKITWKRSLNVFLSTALVASSLSFAGYGQQAYASETSYVGPGGLAISNTDFVSYVDIEKGAKQPSAGVYKLQDLAGGFDWNNSTQGTPINWSNVTGGRINFHEATDTQNTNLLFVTQKAGSDIPVASNAGREVFSVQKSGGSGFPWEFGQNADRKVKYSDESVVASFGTTPAKTITPTEKVTSSSILNVLSTPSLWDLSINGRKQNYTPVTHTVDWKSDDKVYGDEYLGWGSYNRFANGKIAEMLVFNRTLSDAERHQVNSYLAFKYGLTLKKNDGSNDDYIASDGSTKMWAADQGDYTYRVTGIGRDIAGGIEQKQAKSEVDGANVTIALGNTIHELNKENTEDIPSDLSFFTFSDNDLSAGFTRLIDNQDLPINLVHVNAKTQTTEAMLRIFKVQKSSAWQDQTVTLKADGTTSAGYKYYLLINDSDPAFPKASTKVHALDSGAGTVTLNSSELQNASFFTFVQQVDKKSLEAVVNAIDAENLHQSEYTDVAWGVFEQALEAAKAVLTDVTKTPAEVAAAETQLTEAKVALKLKMESTPQSAVLEPTADSNNITVTFDKDIQLSDLTGFSMMVNGNQVMPESFQVVENRLILSFPKEPDLTGQVVTLKYDATGDLNGPNETPIQAFELPVEDVYTAAFEITQPDTSTIITGDPVFGGKVLSNIDTPSTVTVDLTNAENQTISGEVNYPADGEWTFIPDATLPDGTYTLTVTATDGTRTAIKTKSLTIHRQVPVDKTKLEAKIHEEEQLVADSYTPVTWGQYQTALTTARTIFDSISATQEEIDAALASLTAAQDALVSGLSSLTPSTGALSPSFSSGNTSYTMNVGYSTNQIQFTALPVDSNGTVSISVDEQVVSNGVVPLKVGDNMVVVTVKSDPESEESWTMRYYIKVNRANDTSNNGNTGSSGNAGGASNAGSTPTVPSGPTKTIVNVDLEIAGDKPVEKTTVAIERTKHANGDISDYVALTESNAKEAITKAKQIGNDIARIVLPDVNDEVKEAKVDIPKQVLQLFRDNGLALEIASENGNVSISASSMEGIDTGFYFHLVPVRNVSERQVIEERARAEQVVRDTLQSDNVHVVARPMTIETNMASRPVQVTLPLKGVNLPTDAVQRQLYLNKLAIFIEHSDGEKAVSIPQVVTMGEGELGLQFTVKKFSTFTIIRVQKPTEGKHEAYIKGFQDGTFGPDKNVTRGQVATMIARILGVNDAAADTAPFKDVASNHYAASAIAFVKERGIMNGDLHGNFHASANITRAEMATVVANFKQLPVEPGTTTFTFNDTQDHWAQWVIEASRTAGIVNGRQDGSFEPDKSVTRAEAVVMMNRMFERGPLYGVSTSSFGDVTSNHWAFNDIEEAATTHEYVTDEAGVEQRK